MDFIQSLRAPLLFPLCFISCLRILTSIMNEKKNKKQLYAYHRNSINRFKGAEQAQNPTEFVTAQGADIEPGPGVKAAVLLELLMTTSQSFPPVIIYRCKMKSVEPNLSQVSAATGGAGCRGKW